MLPAVEILGRSIPSYWLCALIGFLVCGIGAVLRHRNFKDLQQVDITNAAALLLIGMIAGGRILSIITLLPIVFRNWAVFREDLHLLFKFLSNGLVFYGGLFGAVLSVFLYLKKYRLDRNSFFDYLVPFFPLFHVFGRIGCFLTGCCHGKYSERFGIAFAESTSAQNGIPYFPIQLVCSACNLILFLILLRFEKKHHKEGRTLSLYLILYALGRFIIEFFRGDEIRGIFFGLSTSQWISLFILSFYLFRVFRKYSAEKTLRSSKQT